MNNEGKHYVDMNFEPIECVIFFQSTKFGTHKNIAIHGIVAF